MSDDSLNIDHSLRQKREVYNLVVDCFLSDPWTEALAAATGILANRHPYKPRCELLTLILVAGICNVINESTLNELNKAKQNVFSDRQNPTSD